MKESLWSTAPSRSRSTCAPPWTPRERARRPRPRRIRSTPSRPSSTRQRSRRTSRTTSSRATAGRQFSQTEFADSPFAAFVEPDQLNESFRVKLIDPRRRGDPRRQPLQCGRGAGGEGPAQGLCRGHLSILNAASFTAVGVAALMLVAAVLLIATTIRLSAFSRRRELGIMRLVGASNRFVRSRHSRGRVRGAGRFGARGGRHRRARALFVQGYAANSLLTTTTTTTTKDRSVGMQDAAIVVPVLIVVGAVLARSLRWCRDLPLPQGVGPHVV